MKHTPITKPPLSQFHTHPNEWPCWPYLPVKNSRKKDATGFRLLGLMVEGKATVYDACLFDKTSLQAGKVHGEYSSAMAAEQDGWEVD